MYCPKCGIAEQVPESYCRKCGQYLHDLDNPQIEPAEHTLANMVLSALTVVISFTLAGLLYYFDFAWPEGTILTNATAGFLFAIGCWNIHTFWRSLLLRKHFKENRARLKQASGTREFGEGKDTAKFLHEADLEKYQPASVTDRTTRQLENAKRESQSP